ncbi:pullulanase-type alpha-1,6-glucosidase [Gilvimarinus sp. SDUM040013]|uniref:pullulanase n=1 Tax=Gilvimarinus gilvus TaxID=3058038 RepID=A0ABU4RWE2_9GAMM|nr:pullulanase-type alpha-1,6-glucosidase [Gilvimarinus sp. SDUM040013]MDO3385204.1 pullulanase-type alpha-1,6-glucosidase [Gilvimarinus sp. SDUM040013]MDX6849187.1 pullulanase-type alpha-1,6-glucosidase [Gilvimarinus sp. SDUM040013]
MGYKHLAGVIAAALISACGSDTNIYENHSSSSLNSSSVASSDSSSSMSSSSDVSFELPVELTDTQAIVFYQREDGNYDSWGLHLWNNDNCSGHAESAVTGITWDSPMPASGVDETLGAYFVLDLANSATAGGCLNFIVHSGDDKALGEGDLTLDLSRGNIALAQHGLANIEYPQDSSGESPLPFTLTQSQAAIFYMRPDADYDNWGLHLWNGGNCNALADNSINGVTWDAPMPPTGIDSDRGAYFILDLNDPGGCINFIVHQGDTKALGDADLAMDLTEGNIAFTEHGASAITYQGVSGPAQVSLAGFSAHWVDTNTLLWNTPDNTTEVKLYTDSTGTIAVSDNSVIGNTSITLATTSIKAQSVEKFPHLGDWQAWHIDTNTIDANSWLAGELVAAAYDSDGTLLKATSVQTQGAVDAYYTSHKKLGAWVENGVTHFAVWAPTAHELSVETFTDSDQNAMNTSVAMTREEDGVWVASIANDLHGHYYRYNLSVYHYLSDQIESVKVTDPYSLSLSENSALSQVVDLNRADTMPAGWQGHAVPALDAPEDHIIYEVHIRDFSALDSSTPEQYRGKYLAFTDSDSAPVQHLAHLQQAGLNTIHLLPTFDIATIDEATDARVDINGTVGELCALNTNASVCDSADANASLLSVLQSFDTSTGDAQALMNDLRAHDSFNWGYDPFHYSAPEGSYATNADGFTRIIEFRSMVQALHNMGLRVVMDVVYNHTNASGLWDASVLDKLVPGYYHRRNELSGAVETSSCCDNTASEHTMMEKLMVDSLVIWADAYQIDGFRFDLMGHHMRRNILAALQAVQAIDPDTYFYGEGWNFGEVVDNRRGTNAVQVNMAGTGVGSFNDRIRDAVRGGGPFDSGDALRRNQGFGTGLYHYPNEFNTASESERSALIDLTDRLRVNLAGSLTSFDLTDRHGNTVTGGQVPYFDLFAGYTQDPQESINYISKHDNQTLWDNLQYKAASSLTSAERVRMQNFSLSVPMLAQGIPFIHMGVDLLRSKSMQRDSYDSGDWFNRVDFTATHNNWNVGLPREDKDASNWDLIGQIIADLQAAPSSDDIAQAKALFAEWLTIRSGSPLFRLNDAQAVNSHLRFHNTGPDQIPGLIVMTLEDNTNIDPNFAAITLVFNPTAAVIELPAPLAGDFQLHPAQSNSVDATTRQAAVMGDQLSVPGLTTAVFVAYD